MPDRAAIALAPEGTGRWLGHAVEQGGGRVVDAAEANALVWADPADPAGLGALLDARSQIEWVQLPWAGIEPYVEVIRAHADRTWTCGKGVYAEPVAEHALALALAGLRHLGPYARAASWTRAGRHEPARHQGGHPRRRRHHREPAPPPRARSGATSRWCVGARLPWPAPTRSSERPALDGALTGATLVVLALALTPETTGVLDRRRLELLAEDAWVVNVARGGHIVTDDLVAVLAEGRIGGAALDVTDPGAAPG